MSLLLLLLMTTEEQYKKITNLQENLQIEFADLPNNDKASFKGENLIGQITGIRKVMEILNDS
jgi:hypothetical protein